MKRLYNNAWDFIRQVWLDFKVTWTPQVNTFRRSTAEALGWSLGLTPLLLLASWVF